jgi:hypothetical protein
MDSILSFNPVRILTAENGAIRMRPEASGVVTVHVVTPEAWFVSRYAAPVFILDQPFVAL